jgi:hypothetical protein
LEVRGVAERSAFPAARLASGGEIGSWNTVLARFFAGLMA